MIGSELHQEMMGEDQGPKGVRRVFAMIREDDLKYDPWGTSMKWHFSLCEVLTEWAPPYPHHDWGFRMAMGGPETDAMEYQELSAMMDEGEIDSDDLFFIGKVLHRYETMLERKGKSY